MSLLKYHNWKIFSIIYESQPANIELFHAIKQAVEVENEKLSAHEKRYTIQNISVVSSSFSEVESADALRVEQIIKDTFFTTRSIYFLFFK